MLGVVFLILKLEKCSKLAANTHFTWSKEPKESFMSWFPVAGRTQQTGLLFKELVFYSLLAFAKHFVNFDEMNHFLGLHKTYIVTREQFVLSV